MLLNVIAAHMVHEAHIKKTYKVASKPLKTNARSKMLSIENIISSKNRSILKLRNTASNVEKLTFYSSAAQNVHYSATHVILHIS